MKVLRVTGPNLEINVLLLVRKLLRILLKEERLLEVLNIVKYKIFIEFEEIL